MGTLMRIDFKSKAGASRDESTTIRDLYYGPFNYPAYATLHRIYSITQRDWAEGQEDDMARHGYDFPRHMALTRAVNSLSIQMKGLYEAPISKHPPKAEFRDLGTSLRHLRTYYLFKYTLTQQQEDEEQTLNDTGTVRLKTDYTFYESLIDKIRAIEDAIEDYAPPPPAKIFTLFTASRNTPE